jgi:hypothetical protein
MNMPWKKFGPSRHEATRTREATMPAATQRLFSIDILISKAARTCLEHCHRARQA